MEPSQSIADLVAAAQGSAKEHEDRILELQVEGRPRRGAAGRDDRSEGRCGGYLHAV